MVLLKRTNKKFVEDYLGKKKDWKILDIGCGYTANKYSNHVADTQDFSHLYKDKKFTLIKDKKLPFANKEFNFVIASHVLEHVEDIEFFIKELERVANSGYIEVPTRLEDNLVDVNENAHVWWINFDDINNSLFITKRKQIIEPFLSVSTVQNLRKFFRDSLVTEIFWENKIDYCWPITKVFNSLSDLRICQNIHSIKFYF
ncbi:MAG: methyltransferase domain-containing protein [Proteobacteria bacterium]|nr:methyltransferase domain-containing protein [Candidatus Fonsibacter lacus]